MRLGLPLTPKKEGKKKEGVVCGGRKAGRLSHTELRVEPGTYAEKWGWLGAPGLLVNSLYLTSLGFWACGSHDCPRCSTGLLSPGAHRTSRCELRLLGYFERIHTRAATLRSRKPGSRGVKHSLPTTGCPWLITQEMYPEAGFG